MSVDQDPMTRVLAALEASGCEPTPCGDGQWESRCPAHVGARKNLAVARGDTGAAVVHCHHEPACSAEEIVSALGLKLADLFPPKAKPGTAARKRREKYAYPSLKEAVGAFRRKRPEITSTQFWTYNKADGTRAFVVVRFNSIDKDGKPDKTYMPAHEVPGGWQWGDPPGKLPLYQLDQLPAEGWIFLTEGEKGADAVRAIGLAATTTAHGAKSPHKTDIGPLAGRRIAILPDNDVSGLGYARKIAGLLFSVTPPAEVRTIHLPGLNEDGDDVVDFIDARRADGREDDEIRAELAALVESARPEQPRVGGYHLTDHGNARRLVRMFGDRIRYCWPWKSWYIWTGNRWETDESGEIYQFARQAVDSIYDEADEAGGEKGKAIREWAQASESRKLIENMIALARSERGIPVGPLQWDQDPWAFNCANGTIDLRTGKLKPHDPHDLITMISPVAYDPDATAPRWEQFEREIFAGDEELIGYVRRVLGCGLTADDELQEIMIAHGDGSNGKNVLFDTVLDVMGDYGTVAEPSLLLQTGFESHPTGLMDLFGKRLVQASETEDGKRFSESLVKRITGDKRLKARRMRENFVTFKRTFKVFLATNHRPEVKGCDHAIWRRIRLIPFAVKFAKQGVAIKPPYVLREDPHLLKALASEAPGILAILVRGCLDWQAGGVRPAAAVIAATDEYRAEMDSIQEWLEEACTSYLDHPVLKEQAREKAASLYEAYVTWAKKNGVEPQVRRTFGNEMEHRGYVMHKSNGACWRLGISLSEMQEMSCVGANGEDRGYSPF